MRGNSRVANERSAPVKAQKLEAVLSAGCFDGADVRI